MEGSSSSNPGNSYPYPYPCPSHVTMKLSSQDTYDVWKTQMLCLLKSHGMLHFIQLETLNGYNYDIWGRSDALVKGWILGSLSNQMLKYVVNSIPNKDFTAKEAWDKLQTMYDLPLRAGHDRGPKEISRKGVESETIKQKNEEEIKDKTLHAAIVRQQIELVKQILAENITLRDKITFNGNTALHVAVGTSSNNREFLENLLNLATKDNQQSLDMRNSEGSTLLHVAAIVGNTEAAKMLVQHHGCLYMLFEKDNEGQTPLNRALSNMHTDTYIYLSDEYLNSPNVEKLDMFDSTEIVVNAISSKDYDSACKMAELIKDPDTVLMAVAQNFPQNVNKIERHKMLLFAHVPVKLKFVEDTQRKEKAYRDANQLLRLITTFRITSTAYNNAIFEATRQNAVEVVKEIVSQFPNIIWNSNEDGHNIIQHAVINRSENVYNLLYQMSEHKNTYRTIKDPFKNNLLHLAARLAPKKKLDPISGAALQIQQELQWFKEVESFVCPLNVIQKNSFGETPQMVFTKEHKKLLIEGEKWMKEAAQSCSITAVLITTIMFAAAITVPGGNKQDSGMPVFDNKFLLSVFATFISWSFIASIASLLTFLSILIGRFSEQDFLFKLPLKLSVGLATLLMSTIGTLIAFVTTWALLLH
ncbi:hypothetical protein R6Q59_016569 [Mikania micrantha]|uniref:PGG domain-containing protein n=1 Tax=Mikania micrantha TaxID=192012 RepID=A0A5N6PJE3_9ASTR|nr:hypothetical protein E3N88_09575 [Mikania micrantha]